MGWLPDDEWMAQKMAKKGGGKGNGSTQNQPKKPAAPAQNQQKKAAPKAVPTKPDDILAQVMALVQQNFMGGASVTNPEMLWKTKFNDEVKKNSIDEKPVYAAEANPEGQGWIGTLTVNGQQYTAPEAVPSKKAADNASAKVAFQALFPDAFKKVSQASGAAGMSLGIDGGAKKGQKRKQSEGKQSEDDSNNFKNKLAKGVQLMINNVSPRNCTKEDIVYVVTEQEGPPKTYMATVTIVEYEGKAFSGEWCDSKMQAEQSAANAACTAMADMLVALEESHAVKKKAKMAEELAKKEAKKAAQAAA